MKKNATNCCFLFLFFTSHLSRLRSFFDFFLSVFPSSLCSFFLLRNEKNDSKRERDKMEQKNAQKQNFSSFFFFHLTKQIPKNFHSIKIGQDFFFSIFFFIDVEASVQRMTNHRKNKNYNFKVLQFDSGPSERWWPLAFLLFSILTFLF